MIFYDRTNQSSLIELKLNLKFEFPALIPKRSAVSSGELSALSVSCQADVTSTTNKQNNLLKDRNFYLQTIFVKILVKNSFL